MIDGSADDHGVPGASTFASVAAIALALVKLRIIMREFMDVRHAPRVLRTHDRRPGDRHGRLPPRHLPRRPGASPETGPSLGAAASEMSRRPGRRPLSPTQLRTLDVALELFAVHGVGGTSLQMIADALGVTKAAVYHQFRPRTRSRSPQRSPNWRGWCRCSTRPRQSRRPSAHGRSCWRGWSTSPSTRRRTVGSILRDPLIVGFFTDHEGLREIMVRTRRILSPAGGPENRVRPALLVAALSGAVLHPFINDIDDRVLREELLRMGRRYLGMPA